MSRIDLADEGVGEMERKGITCNWASLSSQHLVPSYASLFSQGPAAIYSVMQNEYKEGCEEHEIIEIQSNSSKSR